MPKLYADGLVSDASIALGRITPAVRDATEVSTRATTEATRETGRKADRAVAWLLGAYAQSLAVASPTAVATVRTAGNAAGFSTADVNAALARIDSGSRLAYDGTNVTRRF